MSLYGALFGGVSGLAAQGAKIGVISDNIANVNTVGYKESEALFETLVINSNSTVSYQTGGVRGESRMKVDKQGLLLSTESPTDIAISGAGFFTVNAQIDGSGTPLYTRAGSFRQDSLGNFVNAAGFYLQGWPLDRDGNLPGEGANLNTTSFANLDSLETVNIESASGVAQATTKVKLGANLDAGEVVYPGESITSTMDRNNTVNFNIDAETIIASSEYNIAGANDIARGDAFEVVTGNGLNYTYEYGGYTVGRSITTSGAANNAGDGLINNDRLLDGAAGTLANTQFVADTANTFVITFPSAHGLVSGDTITIAGSAGVSVPDGAYTVTALSNNTVQITVPAHGIAVAASPAAGEFAAATLDYEPYDTAGVIFDANSATEAFFGVTGTSRFTTAALSFTISTGSDTHTFTYTASSPNTISKQFNNLNTLAEAINEVNGLSARVANGRLMVSAEDANNAITFANGEFPTGTFDANKTGIDWISELDIADVSQGSRRFNTMKGLAELVNADDGVTAVINNALSNASIEIRVDDPLDTIQLRDLQDSALMDLTAVPAMTYSATSATGAAGEDIVVTVNFGAATTFSTTYGLQAGDIIDLQNESAAVIAALGLPAGFPNVAGQSLINSSRQIIVSNVNEAAGTFDFTIPGAYNTGGYPVGPTTSVAGTATGTLSILGEGNQGSMISELFADTTNLVADPNVGSLNGTTYAAAGPQSTGVLGPEYDSSGVVGSNMASGDITAQFSRNVRIYDALGAGHDLRYSFIKIDQNEWAVEVHAIPATDVSTSLVDGQVAVGTVTFNGDGSLRSVSAGLTTDVQIVWTNGAEPSLVTLDWGTAGQPFGTPNATSIGDTDGLGQFDADYKVDFVNQNGAPVGELVSVSIDEEGFVIASYSNGETQNLYKLPIADFANPNGLRAITGNVFAETRASGTVNLREAGTSGVGDVVGAALEQSNVELSQQLTDMIVAQRAYQSNTRVISTSDELLEQLNQL